jgi:hypothetical protein
VHAGDGTADIVANLRPRSHVLPIGGSSSSSITRPMYAPQLRRA